MFRKVARPSPSLLADLQREHHTLKQLAASAGVHRSTMRRWLAEAGLHRPRRRRAWWRRLLARMGR